MGAFKTLSELQEATKRKEKGNNENQIPRYFTVKDGESYRIRFRQELTEDSKQYDPDFGPAEVVQVHVSPSDFKKTAVCTKDKAEYGYKCWACEQIAEDFKWKAKPHLVINVAVLMQDDDGNQSWQPRILDQKFSAQHVAQDIVEFAAMNGTIMDRDYMFKRNGAGTDTQYKLLPLDKGPADDSIEALDSHDVTSVYREISYAEQPGRFLGSEDTSSSKSW